MTEDEDNYAWVRALTPEQAAAYLADPANPRGLTGYELEQLFAKTSLMGQTLCPGCNETPASNRQSAPKAHRCGWCGYDHDSGEHAYLVPA